MQHDQMICPYLPGIRFANFPDLEAKLAKDYDILIRNMWYPDTNIDAVHVPTHRYWLENKITFLDGFYYINKLYDNNPQSVADIGSGEGTFAKYFPNITSFEPNPSAYSNPDSTESFNDEFVKKYEKAFDCAMAINSLQYVNLEDFPKRIDDAMKIVKDSFLFTIDANQIKNYPPEVLATEHLNKKTNEIYYMFLNSGYKIKMVDYLHDHFGNDYMTRHNPYPEMVFGTLRIIISH